MTKKNAKTISYKLQFLDCSRFMAGTISNLFGNLVEGIHKIKFENKHDNKNCKAYGNKYMVCGCCLE